ncbi:MAG: tandem-95 repeat protein [Verrucomicrobiia bacterium]
MKKIIIALTTILVASVCFAQSTFVVYDNTVNDQQTTFQIGQGETVGDEVIFDNTYMTNLFTINYFSFTYWGNNFSGNEQMKVYFYKNDGAQGIPNTELWNSGWFGIPGTAKSQVVFDSGLNVPVDANHFTWAVTLDGIESGESAGLWIFSPPDVGNNYTDYWYNDGSGWQLRAGTQSIDFEAKIKAVAIPPIVNLTAPADGSYAVAGSSVTLSATASDPDGWIQKVEFYVDSNKVGEDTTSPYSISWNAGLPSDVTIYAKAIDSQGSTTDSTSVTLHIVPNTAPSFTKGSDITVAEDSGTYTEANWATSISPGPSYESGQSVNFIVSNDNNSLFAQQPQISPNGTLTFQPAPDANGSATVTVTLHDDGGTLGGGQDTSAPQTFTITVTPVNDAPVVQNISANTQEDTLLQIQLLGSDVDNDSLTYEVVSQPAHGNVSIVGDIATYTPAQNYNGTDSFTYRAFDGTVYSENATVTINIAAVNDISPSYFGAPVSYLTDPMAVAVVTGDFIRDGKKDVAVASAGTQSINIFKNIGDGNFTQVNNIPINGTPTAMVAADFNYDGYIDLAVAVEENKIIYLYNDRSNTGTFTQDELNLDFTPIGLVTAKFDGDARPDLATLSSNPNTLNIIYSSGPTIAQFNVGGSDLVALAAGDFNRDGRTDIAIVDATDNVVRIMKQKSDRTFMPMEPNAAFDVGSNPNSIVFADFNGDNRADIAVGNLDDQTISVLLADASGTSFTLSQTIYIGMDPVALAATDLDKDNIKELIVATSTDLIVLKGLSGGTFQYDVGNPNVTFAVGEGMKTIAIDELNNDSSLDAVVANYDDQNIYVLLNNRTPKVYSGTYMTLEDTPIDITLRGTYGPLTYSVVGPTIFGTTQLKSGYTMTDTTVSPMLTYTPGQDFFGNDSLYFMATDGVKNSAVAKITIRVLSVNDKPSFDLALSEITIDEDPISMPTYYNFIQNLNKGAANESGQAVRYIVSNSNSNLFQRQPYIDYSGTLSFKPKKDAFGSATVTVVAKDSGGTRNGGVDTSDQKTFVINVENVNDAPVITRVLGSSVIYKNTQGALQVYVSDQETPAGNLIVTATSSVQGVIADSNITVENYGSYRLVRFTPVPNTSGRTLLTFTVDDGTNTTSKAVWVTVR